jgi:long-subunit fatty acid transport protein
MKKILTLSLFLLAFVLIGTDLFAYGSRRSLGYVKTLNRNATIDAPDAAQYNPAGTVKLKDGLWIEVTNQMAYKTYSSELSSSSDNFQHHGIKSVDEKPVWLNPAINAIYKKGKGAVFFTFDVPAGGGELEYTNSWRGLSFAPGTVGHGKLGSDTLAFSLGVAWEIHEMLSISAGMRYLKGSQFLKAYTMGGKLLDLDYEIDGFTGFIGINFQPIDMVNLAVTYQPHFILRGKVNTYRDLSPILSGGSIVLGQELASYTGYNISALGAMFGGVSDETYDGKLYAGIGIRPIKDLTIQASFYWQYEGEKAYFNHPQRNANVINGIIAGDLSAATTDIMNYKKKDNFGGGIGAEYKIGMFTPSIGVAYDRTGGTPHTNRSVPWDPDLSAWQVGVGLVISPIEMLDITVAAMKPFYQSSSSWYQSGTVLGKLHFEKDVWVYGFGLTLKILK